MNVSPERAFVRAYGSCCCGAAAAFAAKSAVVFLGGDGFFDDIGMPLIVGGIVAWLAEARADGRKAWKPLLGVSFLSGEIGKGERCMDP